jgi:hypothetical protein
MEKERLIEFRGNKGVPLAKTYSRTFFPPFFSHKKVSELLKVAFQGGLLQVLLGIFTYITKHFEGPRKRRKISNIYRYIQGYCWFA